MCVCVHVFTLRALLFVSVCSHLHLLVQPFAEITALTDVQEGIIVRCIQRLYELLRDVRNAARIIGDPRLFNKMEEAMGIIKRDIVFAASLYTQWAWCFQHESVLYIFLSFVGCLTSLQRASVSLRQICSDNCTCYHTEIEFADQTFYLSQSQYTDIGPSCPGADPITPGAWQGASIFKLLTWVDLEKRSMAKAWIKPRSAALEADALTTRPTRWLFCMFLCWTNIPPVKNLVRFDWETIQTDGRSHEFY